MTDPQVLVKKHDTRDPKFDSLEAEGKYERDLKIDRDMRASDRIIYKAIRDRSTKRFGGGGREWETGWGLIDWTK